MPRKFKQTAEFYNFICHFGAFELLEYLDEIVAPAFLRENRVRTFGQSKFLLLDVSKRILEVDREKRPAIVGRFVVDTSVTRAQVLEDGQLKESYRSMKTAPSAVFALLLDNHKLLYAKEVPGGPSVGAFRTTMQALMSRQRRDYVELLYQTAKKRHETGDGSRVSRKAIFDSIPEPDLKIVPLLGESGIKDFLARFSVLKELQIRVIKPNSEIDNDGFFEGIQRAREDVNAEYTTLAHRNSEGLKKTAAAKQAAPAMHGNAIVKFSGLGAHEEKLSGSNEDFKVVSPPMDLPTGVPAAAKAMLKVFSGMVADGLIRLADGKLPTEHLDKLKKIFTL